MPDALEICLEQCGDRGVELDRGRLDHGGVDLVDLDPEPAQGCERRLCAWVKLAHACTTLCERPRNVPAECVFMAEMSQALIHARTRTRLLLSSFAVLALSVGTVAATNDASAQKKKPAPKPPAQNMVVLGASAQTAQPACPSTPCQAIGKVTGFQTTIGAAKKPFLAPFDGKVVAWSIKLSAPTEKQREFFDDFYGGPPSARISVLKPILKRKLRYKLRSQSPVEALAQVMGSTTTFTLKTPLPVRRGQMVGLTVPTWAPAFGVGLAKDNAWRASRKPSKCTATADISAGRGHEALGTERIYGCSYTTARLLYSATVVRG